MRQLLFTGFILLSFAFVFTACDGENNNKQNSTTSTEKTKQLANDEMYTCIMHNEVMSAHQGICPKCGMKLVEEQS